MWATLRHTKQLRHFCRSTLRKGHFPRSKDSVFFVQSDSTIEKRNVPRYTDLQTPKEQFKTDTRYKFQRPFLDPNNFLPEVEITDPSIRTLATEKSHKAALPWQQVCQRNSSEVPRPGSIVEFITNTSEVQLGLVLRAPTSQFHFHNRMIVLAMNNDLVRVYPQDTTFVANEVFDSGWVESLEILQNRFNESFEPRIKLVQLVHYFLLSSKEIIPLVREGSAQMYSHVASANGASPVTLLKLVNIYTSYLNTQFKSLLDQSALLFAIHSLLCSDFKHWMVPGCMPLERSSNLSAWGYSNSIPYNMLYFATPIPVMSSAHEFLAFGELKLNKFDDLVNRTISTRLKYDDLVLLFTIWEGTEFLPIIQMIRFAIIYPHPQLLKVLSKCSVLGDAPLTQRSLYDFLIALGIYENPQNYMTDPLISSFILGDLEPRSLAGSSVKHLKPSTVTTVTQRARKTTIVDHFSHLRQRSYFNDHTIYILPGVKQRIAVSLEKANTRRYSINLHIIDPITKICPSSSTFVEWAQNLALLQNWTALQKNELSLLLPDHILSGILFSQNDDSQVAEFLNVDDLTAARRRLDLSVKFQSCMTISFDYNPSQTNPLENLPDKVSVTFDDLSGCRIKKLDGETLEASLLGKSQPSILNTFRLFNRAAPMEHKENELGTDDHQNLNFIYSFLKIHFTLRNRSNATIVKPQGPESKLQKSHSFDSTTGNILTELQFQDKELNYRSSLFLNETEVLCGSLAATFCSRHKIPVIFRNQNFVDTKDDVPGDGVVIKHKNSFFPEFTANSYFQTAFARDKSGYVSTPASLFAYSHLDRIRLESGTCGMNVSYGLDNGYVNVVDPTENVEAYLNQLQILSYVHNKCMTDGSLSAKMNRFSHLKALGYPLHGPMDVSVIESHVNDLDCSQMGAKYLLDKLSRYWLLKKLEQDPDCIDKFTCTITRVHDDVRDTSNTNAWIKSDFELRKEMYVTVKAYCEEIETEVSVLIPADSDCTIGTQIIADEIIFVDSISGSLILK